MDEPNVKEFTEKVNKSIADIQSRQKEIGDELQKNQLNEKQLNELRDEFSAVSQKLEIEGKSIGDYAKELQKHNDNLETRIKELEQTGGAGRKSQAELIYDQLQAGLKEGKETFMGKLKKEDGMEIKATVGFDTSFTENFYQTIPQDTRLPGIQQAPMPMMSVWNLMNPGATSKRYVPYVERNNCTSGASTVDDVTGGGEADLSFTDKQAMVKKISVKLYASRDSIDDVDYLQSEIQRLLNHDVVQKRENQILTGTGTGNDLHGLVYASNPIAKAFAKPTGFKDLADPDESAVLTAALTQVGLGINNDFETGYQSNGIVIHPVTRMNMINERASDGHYRKHPLLAMDGKSFNGIPLVESKFVDPDSFIVGDFRQARPFVRRNISLKILDQNASLGESDVLTFVLTYRVAFFVPSPHDYAFSFGTFDAAKSAITETAG